MADQSTLRPVQLGLMEGTDRAVGPMLGSVVYGNNAELMHQVAPLYLTGSVLDVTYGRGMWWQRFLPEPFGHHDIAQDGVDFRDLPHADRSWRTVCFDPPYVPRQGIADATMGRDQDFRDRFGLAESRGGLELQELIADGLAECARVMDRWLLVKCNDYTNGRQFHLGHVRVIDAALSAGLRCHDLIVHASGTGPGGGQIREVKRARRAHSYLLVFERTGRTQATPQDPKHARPRTPASCSNCERCTWNPGPDCGRPEHPHCQTCGHCNGRHTTKEPGA